MPYLGNAPAEAYSQISYQDLTGGSGTSFTLDYPAGSAGEIEVFVNNVRQEPTVAYTVSGTSLTMTGSIAATDDFYVVFQDKAQQTIGIPEKQSDGTYVFPDDVLVGKSSASTSVAGIGLFDGGLGTFTRASAQPLDLNRQTDDGDIILLRKDGTSVGSIGTASSTTYVAGDSSGIRFGSTAFMPSTTTGANKDNSVDLGHSAVRYKDLYLSGGVYLGGTGSANLLDDVETGTFTPSVEGSASTGTTTYSQQFGYYTKVGNQVSVVIQLNYTALTGTGNLEISGLPFTSSNNTQNYAPMSVLTSNLNWSSGSQVVGLQFQNSTLIYLYGVADDAQAALLTCVNEAASFRIAGTYFTT